MKQETFRKGQTIKFRDGPIAIVLNDGLTEKEIFEQYRGQEIQFQSSDGENMSFVYDVIIRTTKRVWYRILIGDEKKWMIDDALQCRVYGKWPSRR